VRASLDFAPGLVVLREARNVTYRNFVAPGQVLMIESVCKELAADRSLFAARGLVDGQEIVKGQLTLRHLNLADIDAGLADIDARNRVHMRALFGRLLANEPAVTVSGA
jgi:hypothetical protein